MTDEQLRKQAGDQLLVQFIDLMETLHHDVLCGVLRPALEAKTAREAELVIDRLQDLFRDIGKRALADALNPIVQAYYGPPPERPPQPQAAPADPDAPALRCLLNEMRCRVAHGVNSHLHLDGLLKLYDAGYFHKRAKEEGK